MPTRLRHESRRMHRAFPMPARQQKEPQESRGQLRIRDRGPPGRQASGHRALARRRWRDLEPEHLHPEHQGRHRQRRVRHKPKRPSP
ncbi:MAG TPA: hypothetical protein VGJ28_26015 [Micromonosporaceae bacterium]